MFGLRYEDFLTGFPKFMMCFWAVVSESTAAKEFGCHSVVLVLVLVLDKEKKD